MGEYQDLIRRTLTQLDEQADTIVNHIAKLVSEATSRCRPGRHLLFHIDDRSRYSAYFHVFEGIDEIGKDESLDLPDFLEDAVNQAEELDFDEDEPSLNFYDEVNEKVFDLITSGWLKGGGDRLGIRAFITLHDADYYLDLSQQEVFQEADLQDLLAPQST
jgi:hypothetical protein